MGAEQLPISKFLAALIGIMALGLIAIEARDANWTADRIDQQCQTENITDIHVRECRIRLLQAKPDERFTPLDTRR